LKNNARISFSTSESNGTSVVNSALPASDGRILLSGVFTQINGVRRNQLARLTADAALDPSFDANAVSEGSQYIQLLDVQPDGRVLITRITETITETNQNVFSSRYQLARLNIDGSIDNTFSDDLVTFFPVQSAVVQPDGKILVAGFDPARAGLPSGLLRLNSDGSLDPGFQSAVGALTNGSYPLATLLVQSDGRILFRMSSFTNSVIGRLNTDGTVDPGFLPAGEASGSILFLSLQPDGKLLVGGYRPEAGSYFLRLNPNGSLDVSFHAELPSEAYFFPQAVAVQSDGKIIIGGIDVITPPAHVIRLNSDGSLDTSFNPGTGPNGSVRAAFLQPDGGIVITGYFSSLNGVPRSGFARLFGGDAQPAAPSIFRQSTNQTVYVGDSLTLNVLARGFPIYYQWRFQGTSLAGATNATLRLPQIGLEHSGAYTVIVSNASGTVTSAPIVLTVLTVLPRISLAEALDADGLTWNTNTAISWIAQARITHDQVDAAESAPLLDNQEAWLETTLYGPGTLTFWWKVSSETGYDFLQFYVDGLLQDSISGEVDWQQKTFALSSSHTVRWRYVKDGSLSAGQDRGWLDEVHFVGTPPQPFRVNGRAVPDGPFQLTLVGEIGRRYTIQTSTNLLDWSLWTEVVMIQETLQIPDAESGHCPRRFYRALTR
jgi:uncharacterized delta-60 repeat protein